MAHALDELFMIIHTRLRSAKQRFNEAQDEHKTRYYKGQVDTLRVVLRDIEATKFECGIELHDYHDHTLPEQDIPDKQDQPPHDDAPSISQPTGEEKPKKLKKPRKSKTRKAAAPPESPYASLARQAVKQDIIRRTSSHFLHDLLPQKHVQGYPRLYQVFENDERFRQAIQEALQEAATTPPSTDHHVKEEDDHVKEEDALEHHTIDESIR